jgi:Fe(3+) dicitrate transport protein
VVPGDAMPYVPEHQGSARIVAQHPRGSLALGASARSGMRDEASQGAIPEIGGIPPLFLLDAAAEVRLVGTVRVYANATNLTGSKAIESWRPFGARTVAPLQLNVGLKAGR